MRDNYPQTEHWFSEAVKGPHEATTLDAHYRRAIALGYLKRYTEGSQMMETVSRKMKGRRQQSAQYQIGRLLHEAGDYEGAIKAHTRFLQSKPSNRSKWLWFLGWAHHQNRQCSDAIGIYRTLSEDKNLLVGAKALYWAAQCPDPRSTSAEAKSTLTELMNRAPLSYYGFLGALRLGSPTSPRLIERQEIPDDYPLGAWSKALKSSERTELHAIAELARTGFIAFARLRLNQRVQKRIQRQLPRKIRRKALDQLERLLENWGRRWGSQARRIRRVPWKEGLAQKNTQDIVGAYPPAYMALARAAGREYNVSPFWLLAHMLQESRYKERAQSHAVAMGTMQILPRTGRRIAEKINFPQGQFFDSELFRPGPALRQAAWYLNALRKEYDGNIILAMAAYNGGPRRISDHLRTVSRLPFDAAIEEIGAHESRNYARKVADHLVRYVEIYATDEERKAILSDLIPKQTLPTPRGHIRF